MITPRLRPRLDMEIALPPAELAARVESRLAERDAPCRGLVTPDQIELRIRASDRRFWSPQLVVHVSSRDGTSVLSGHFGPSPHVWTMFLAMYAFVLLSAAFGVCYGVAQLAVEETPWALMSIPVAAVLVALIYVAAGVGQRLGHDQVDVLQEFLERAVDPGSG